MRFGCGLFLLVALCCVDSNAVQRTVRATSGWVEMVGDRGARVFVTVENGTMYDIYIVAVETDLAASAELRKGGPGGSAATPLKEATIPAFDRLEMSADGVHIPLDGLKAPLKPGAAVTLTLKTDAAESISASAVVK